MTLGLLGAAVVVLNRSGAELHIQQVSEHAQMLRVNERSLNEAVRRATGTTAAKLVRERVMLEAPAAAFRGQRGRSGRPAARRFGCSHFRSQCGVRLAQRPGQSQYPRGTRERRLAFPGVVVPERHAP